MDNISRRLGMVFIGLTLCIPNFGQGALFYSCENCEMIDFFKVGNYTLTFGKSNWKMVLYNEQQLKCDEVDTYNSGLNFLTVDNDSTFQLSGIYNTAIGVIRADKIVFKEVFHSQNFDGSFLYNLSLFEGKLIGEKGNSKEGPTYFFTDLTELNVDDPPKQVLVSQDIQDRTINSTFISSAQQPLQAFIPASETTQRRGYYKSTLYQYSINENGFSLLDFNSNKFFIFDKNLKQKLKVILPKKLPWRYSYDYKTDKHYFHYAKKKRVNIFQLDIEGKTLNPIKSIDGAWVSSISGDRIYYTDKKKKVFSVYEISITGKTSNVAPIQLEMPEVVVEAKGG